MKTLSKHLLLLVLTMFYVGCYYFPILRDSKNSVKQGEQKVYIFYTPSEAARLPNDDSLSATRHRIAEMEQWLSQQCGGFSCWKVVGGWRDPSTKKDERLPGYFYWVSCGALSADRIADKIKELFSEKEAYVIEVPISRYAK